MIEIFCTFIIVVFIIAAEQQTRNLARIYKSNNIKPNDYTLYFDLSKQQISEFNSKLYDASKDTIASRGQQLREWIHLQLDARIEKMRSRIVLDDGGL